MLDGICCVVGCRNKQHKGSIIHFYSFPGRAYELERKRKWVEAVHRAPDKNGRPWTPTKNTKICSAHFFGGVKSNDPRHPGHNPTIFPINYSEYGVKGKIFNTDGDSYFVTSELSEKFTSLEQVHTNAVFIDEGVSNWALGTFHKKVLATDPLDIEESEEDPLEVRTSMQAPGVEVKFMRRGKVDIAVATDLRKVTRGDIEAHSNLRLLGGISLPFFYQVLYVYTTETEGRAKYHSMKLNHRDGFFLLLIKMKFAMDFGSLGLIFNISIETANRNFFHILDTFSRMTRAWFCWPTRSEYVSTHKKYSHCKAIVDIVEIVCETPQGQEHAKLFSGEKQLYILKFLLGVAGNGTICCVSKAHPGSTPNDTIIRKSGFLGILKIGDVIIGGKNLGWYKLKVAKRGCSLVLPPFRDLEEKREIARFRNKYERAVQKIKSFEILNDFGVELFPYVDKVVQMCCVLANQQAPMNGRLMRF